MIAAVPCYSNTGKTGMARKVAIVGGGGFGRVLGAYVSEAGAEVVGYLDDGRVEQRIGGAVDPRVLEQMQIDDLYISIGDGPTRERVQAQYSTAGIRVSSFVHPEVFLPRHVDLGDGCVVLPGCQVMPFARIEDGVFLSTGTGVAHHTVVGRFASLASGARLGAGINIGARSSFGVSSLVMTGVSTIGDDARVGAGAVVIRDVAAGATVVGNPARTLA